MEENSGNRSQLSSRKSATIIWIKTLLNLNNVWHWSTVPKWRRHLRVRVAAGGGRGERGAAGRLAHGHLRARPQCPGQSGAIQSAVWCHTILIVTLCIIPRRRRASPAPWWAAAWAWSGPPPTATSWWTSTAPAGSGTRCSIRAWNEGYPKVREDFIITETPLLVDDKLIGTPAQLS